MLRDIGFDKKESLVQENTAALALDVSGDAFYLTGSRYMGCEGPDSDWDFMAEDSYPTRVFLHQSGFTTVFQDYSERDPRTKDVLEKGNVQVQLVNNVMLRRHVRDTIRDHLAEKHRLATGNERSRIWQYLADILDPNAEVPYLF